MSTVLSRLQLRLTKFQVIIASILIFIPLILWSIDGKLRPSISNYFYMEDNHWFITLFTIAAMIYANSGVVDNKKWYNIALGVCLWAIAMTPHETMTVIHTAFAGTFYIGSVFVMMAFSNKNQFRMMGVFGLLTIAGMVGHFVFNLYSLFWAEWIGLLPITVHFIGESLGKIK